LVARLFAISLVCTQPATDATGCGSCPACRKAAHGNHPDVLVVTRLPKKDKRAEDDLDDEDDGDDVPTAKRGELRPFIVVQQIRELNHHATYAPREGRRRVFIVDPADRMHAESQNALLKTLEEPGGQTVIVLVASRPHVLLPTVRSRCFQIGFGAMAPDQLALGLQTRGIESQEARARAALAEGRPGRAISLDLPALAGRRDRLLTTLEALAASSRAASDLGDFADQILGEGEADLLEGLDLVMALLRDAARAASGGGAILHADLAPRVLRLGRALGAHRATEIVALADLLRGDLRLNINKALLCETLLAAVAGAPMQALT
jgi:DNA polymerase-3 subunit delta'